MKSDPKRQYGFYWVRFEGAITIGEYGQYVTPEGLFMGCDTTEPHWHFANSIACWRDREVCELLSPAPLKLSDPAPVTVPYEDLYAVLFRIVRTWQQRQAVGHDLVMAARSIVRRTHPDAYADLLKRWPDTKPSKIRPAKQQEPKP